MEEKPGIKKVALNSLVHVRWQESLSDAIMERLKVIWPIVRDGLNHCSSLEEFETGFLYDMHPEREVSVWERIADTYGRLKACLIDRGHELTGEDRCKVMGLIISRSTGDPHAAAVIDSMVAMLPDSSLKTFEELLLSAEKKSA